MSKTTTTSTSQISLLVSICQLFCFEMAICDDANKMYLLLEWWQQQGRSGIRTIGWVSMKQRMNISCNHTCLQNLASHPTLHLSDFQKSATTERTYLNYKYSFSWTLISSYGRGWSPMSVAASHILWCDQEEFLGGITVMLKIGKWMLPTVCWMYTTYTKNLCSKWHKSL